MPVPLLSANDISGGQPAKSHYTHFIDCQLIIYEVILPIRFLITGPGEHSKYIVLIINILSQNQLCRSSIFNFSIILHRKAGIPLCRRLPEIIL